MSDIIEEMKRKQRERTRSTIITTVVVIVTMTAVIAYSVYDDKKRQRELYTSGGAVGVQNETSHKVTLHLFVRDASEPMIKTIEPNGHWVLRDSMSKNEVSNFPPRNWIDSGYLVFDDTLCLKHVEHPTWSISYNDHCIHDPAHWMYKSLTVRNASRYHPALYRPLRVYYIKEQDYERAKICN